MPITVCESSSCSTHSSTLGIVNVFKISLFLWACCDILLWSSSLFPWWDEMLSSFSCAFWPFTHFLLWNFCSYFLPIFKNWVEFFNYWIVRLSCYILDTGFCFCGEIYVLWTFIWLAYSICHSVFQRIKIFNFNQIKCIFFYNVTLVSYVQHSDLTVLYIMQFWHSKCSYHLSALQIYLFFNDYCFLCPKKT